MKKYFTVHGVLRMLPVLALILSTIAEFSFASASGRTFRICCSLLASSSMFVVYPLTREGLRLSLGAGCLGFFYYAVLWYLAFMLDCFAQLFILPSVLFVHIYSGLRTVMKYRDVEDLFRRDSAWCCAEEDSRAFYISVITLYGALLMVLHYSGEPVPACRGALVAGLALETLMYMKSFAGRTLLMQRKKERKIQNIITADGQSSRVLPEIDNNIMARVYKKVQYYMKTRKPYLSDRFCLSELSETLQINKYYISRSVNMFSGYNFRAYVNHYRVVHSIELMKHDPWLKVLELTFMSGFHSVVTYNMAFRMFMDETPSDMLLRLRMAHPRMEVSKMLAREQKDKDPPFLPDEQK